MWEGRDESFEDMVGRKRHARMAKVDAMSPEMRSLVNEYGLNVVQTLLDQKITKPRRIRHVVETILDEFSPTRGSHSIQGKRKDINTGVATK